MEMLSQIRQAAQGITPPPSGDPGESASDYVAVHRNRRRLWPLEPTGIVADGVVYP
jgi:hypothetical protein